MRGGWVAAVLAASVLAGCTTVVPGAPVAAGPAGLTADVLSDECLLTATELGELVDLPVQPPRHGTVRRSDGSAGAGCAAESGGAPVALVNVYGVPAGTPTDYVRAGGGSGRRELPGAGEAAVVIGTAAGPALQLAGPRHLVTILVSGGAPSDDEWRAAAAAALARLPG